MTFDLADEVRRLREEPPYRDGTRNAKTLFKVDGLRLMLVVFRPGVTFDEDVQRGPISFDVREGRIGLTVGATTVDLHAGDVATVTAGQPWSAVSHETSVVLLHLAWPRPR